MPIYPSPVHHNPEECCGWGTFPMAYEWKDGPGTGICTWEPCVAGLRFEVLTSGSEMTPGAAAGDRTVPVDTETGGELIAGKAGQTESDESGLIGVHAGGKSRDGGNDEENHGGNYEWAHGWDIPRIAPRPTSWGKRDDPAGPVWVAPNPPC